YQETQGEYNAACRYFKTIDIKDLINQRVAGDHNGHRQANKKAIELEISLHFIPYLVRVLLLFIIHTYLKRQPGGQIVA
ncbi:hypothetical protein ACJ8LB_23855, partial [Serratia sp. CY58181]|uniref:hypothetical protein n=1 Tax=Serratia sp. CY58181 TaxID=3383644 RepID=UPI003FA0DA96